MYRQNGDDIVHSQANALLGSRSTLPLDLGRSVADEWSAQTAIARGDQQKAALGSPQPEANDGLTQRVERGAWSVERGAWSVERGAGLRCHVDPIPNSGRAGTTGLAITPKGYGHRFLDDPNTVAISLRRISKSVRGRSISNCRMQGAARTAADV